MAAEPHHSIWWGVSMVSRKVYLRTLTVAAEPHHEIAGGIGGEGGGGGSMVNGGRWGKEPRQLPLPGVADIPRLAETIDACCTRAGIFCIEDLCLAGICCSASKIPSSFNCPTAHHGCRATSFKTRVNRNLKNLRNSCRAAKCTTGACWLLDCAGHRNTAHDLMCLRSGQGQLLAGPLFVAAWFIKASQKCMERQQFRPPCQNAQCPSRSSRGPGPRI